MNAGCTLSPARRLPDAAASGLPQAGILTMRAKTDRVAPGTPLERGYELVNFFRQFELPEEVDMDGIQAEIKHGVLTLRLPKKAKARPRKIELNVG